MTLEFQVRKDNFEQHRLVDTEALSEALPDGRIRVKVERFAFTTNNITYAVAGEKIGYWQFFPPTGGDADGWGIIPVWGFAEVVESTNDDMPAGERLFGYFPTASILEMAPTEITRKGFIEGAAHRGHLPPAYNRYTRVGSESGYDRASDNHRMLLWPLYITSFCLWDALQENSWHGAKQVVIVSASSKTSIGLAYAINDDAKAPPAIGITSPRNLEFVSILGLYQQTVSYDSLTDIDATVPTVIVDMSGNAEVLGRLHRHLDDNMLRCINVGLTHWDEMGAGDGIITERSEFFFAPSHIQKRLKDWGPEEFSMKTSNFMQETAMKTGHWLQLRKLDGLQGLAEIYNDVCAGRIAAQEGLIVEL
jgi:hypothetical protein